MSIVTAVLRFRDGKCPIFQGLTEVKNTILRVAAKSIVRVKNEVLNGNKSAVIRNQKEFTEIYHFKARKELILWETGFILKMR